jgi:hypothetical protein
MNLLRASTVLLASLLPVLPAAAGDAPHGLLVLHLVSNHLGVDGYNEQNPGLGLRFGRGDWYGAAGFYKNSLSHDSVYVGAGRTLARLGPVAFSLNAGLVTGYNVPVAPFLMPEIALNLGRAQVLVDYFPKVKIEGSKTDHALALSIGVPF